MLSFGADRPRSPENIYAKAAQSTSRDGSSWTLGTTSRRAKSALKCGSLGKRSSCLGRAKVEEGVQTEKTAQGRPSGRRRDPPVHLPHRPDGLRIRIWMLRETTSHFEPLRRGG